MLNAIILGLVSLLALSILVVVHEFGHFIIAKLAGVWVEEFGIGLPPRIWGKKIGDTLYSINAIPLGGFVRLHGETGEDKIYYPEKAFVNKASYKKALIVIAGIVVNFVFGVVCFAAIYTFVPQLKTEELGYVQIINVRPDSPAQVAGLLSGDVVKKINTSDIKNESDLIETVRENRGKKVRLEIERETNNVKETKIVSATLKDLPPEEGALGVEMTDTKVVEYFPPLWQRPLIGIQKGLEDSLFLTKAIFFGLGDVATQATQGKVPDGLSGPFKMVAFLIYVIRQGILPLINVLGIISINLAIFNILPIPPLDGSRLLVILGEKLFGRKLSPKIEGFVNSLGMALLLILVLFITTREIPQFISAGSITSFIESTLLKVQ